MSIFLISALLLLAVAYFLNLVKNYSERSLDFLIKYFDLKKSFIDGFKLGWEEELSKLATDLPIEARSEINKISQQMYAHLGSKKVLLGLKRIYFSNIGFFVINKTANELSKNQPGNEQQIVNLFMQRLVACQNLTNDLIKNETRYYINKIIIIKQQYNK